MTGISATSATERTIRVDDEHVINVVDQGPCVQGAVKLLRRNDTAGAWDVVAFLDDVTPFEEPERAIRQARHIIRDAGTWPWGRGGH